MSFLWWQGAVQAEGAVAPADGDSRSNRAKALLLKKKLEDKDRLILEKEELIKVRESQLESKELMLVERDNRVTELAQQLVEKTEEMRKFQSAAGSEGKLGDEQVLVVHEGRWASRLFILDTRLKTTVEWVYFVSMHILRFVVQKPWDCVYFTNGQKKETQFFFYY